MTRKVVQIAANAAHLFALCDDGRIFQLTGAAWSEVTAIPPTTIPQSRDAVATQIGDLAVSLDLSPAERAALEARLLGTAAT